MQIRAYRSIIQTSLLDSGLTWRVPHRRWSSGNEEKRGNRKYSPPPTISPRHRTLDRRLSHRRALPSQTPAARKGAAALAASLFSVMVLAPAGVSAGGVRVCRGMQCKVFSRLLAQGDPPPIHKSCKLARSTTHVMADHKLTSNPSLQSVRFFLQTHPRCKVAPPSRHSLAFAAHRHRLSAVARKKSTFSRAGKCCVERESLRIPGNLSSPSKLPAHFKMSDVQRACPRVSYPTLNRAVSDLKREHLLRCLGRGRDAQWERIGSWSR